MKKNKFQLKREATYKLLLEAGMQCFSEKGYTATSLGDIVARTGHTKGAFYGHFESKEEMFIHIMNYQLELTKGWTDIPRQYDPAHTSLEEVMTATLTGLAEMLKGKSNWILVLVDFYQHTRHNPDMEAIFKEKYREWVAGIERLVVVLKEQGFISHDKDTKLIAMQIIAFNEGFTTFSVLFGSSDPRVLIQGLVKLLG
ncbi:TetR/AcrR family transcriptional regulator [Paenibacillus koleovorans]|uniref:TetR/AcrR family transcriptional regulator n=1 Tax=Paenibacillus koleovorans TaxID=121608 RepID=UPI000FDA9334|nr:TetR family transcriptional regulator [Paenibacillus koleovorans]